jgi:hypothetical protein
MVPGGEQLSGELTATSVNRSETLPPRALEIPHG